MTVVVVGAGIVGLTCAVRLAEAGHHVRVVTREAPLETTSAVAAAVWFPYRVEPPERVDAWAARTYRELIRLANDEPESGVTMRELAAYSRRAVAEPSWRDAVDGFRRLTPAELPAGYADGWCARVPVAETPRYLPWLAARFARAGGAIEVRPEGVPTLAAAAAGAALVVNCSGLGARTLAGDATMVPVRGQVVLVENPGLDRVLLDEDDPAAPIYVIPRRDDCVLGGTAEAGVESLAPDAAVTEAIVACAARLVPSLADARRLGVRVGLRPGRPAVRLELESPPAESSPAEARPPLMPPVIHCYGHGGAGHTVAWGCADEVLALAGRALGTAG
ncbi:MAG TPA: FAD-dependent oxidoreductase [Thermoanaerobaculia bacterium]|jgi:D-amino-acid oxidase|nr:FAD-dependent oxidoreductase [Thermoanaerobaculia bacterium]